MKANIPKIKILLTIAFFIFGCTKIPQKDELEGKADEEICGNLIIDSGEDCDFTGIRSCSEVSEDLIGPYYCNNCKDDISRCIKDDQCEEQLGCPKNSECVENPDSFYLQCDCISPYIGLKCDKCMKGYHYDIDGKCINDSQCTIVGCDNERKLCRISDGKATCVCKYPYTGESCLGCQDEYYEENGDCVTGSCEGVVCGEYERCMIDNDYRPKCFCESEDQDPDDCTECKTGYCWDETRDSNYCRSQMSRQCLSNTSKPENSYDIYDYGWVNCVNNKWDTPECEWECYDNYYRIDNECRQAVILDEIPELVLVSSYKDNKIIMLAPDGNLYNYLDGKVVLINKFPVEVITGARVLPDGNFYLEYSSSYSSSITWGAIMTPDGKEIIKYEINKNEEAVLSFSKGGRIFRGNNELTFPYNIILYNTSFCNNESITLSDEILDSYTVCESGQLFSLNRQGSLKWDKKFPSVRLHSEFAVLDKEKLIVPFEKTSTREKGIYLINSDTGEFETVWLSSADTDTHYDDTSIAVNDNYIVVDSGKGNLYFYDEDLDIVKQGKAGSSDTTPILLDNGNIGIFNRDYRWMIMLNNDLEEVWRRKSSAYHTNFIDGKVFNYDGGHKGAVYSVPGKTEGVWSQYLHDSRLSGSLSDISFVDVPNAPKLISPSDMAEIAEDTVTFTWSIDENDPDLTYTLLLRDPSGFDMVVAGPEKGRSSFTMNINEDNTYEWKVVSQNSEGALNVSSVRKITFTLTTK